MTTQVKELPDLLQPGSKFPNFSLASNDGKIYNHDSFKQTHVIYFYPKALTPGCTTQACNIQEAFANKQMPIPVLGVSPDTVERQVKFAEKYNLNFPLLADADKELAKACGVYGPKTFMGKTIEGVHRIAFIVGVDGTILDVITKVKTKEFAQQITSWLEQHPEAK